MESSFLKECDDMIRNMTRLLFRVLGITACFSNTLGFAANVMAHGWNRDSVFFGICTVLVYALFFYGEKTGKREGTSFWVIVITTLVEFPVMCYLYGHGRTVFCVFGVAVYVFFLKRPVREIFLVLSLVLNGAALFLREYFPEYTVAETTDGAFKTMLLSTLIVMVVTFALLIVVRNVLDFQRENMFRFGTQIEDALIHDALTGAYNRQYMYNTYVMLEQNGNVVAILLDIDDFKQLNDTYGHVFGDEVLAGFAQALMRHTDTCGTVFRFGGEEFLVLFGKVTAEEALRRVEDACTEFRLCFASSKRISITASGGLVNCGAHDNLESALKTADARLYHAKNSGKNRIVYEGDALPPAPERLNRMPA